MDRSLSCLRWCWRGSRRFSCLGGRLLNPGAATPRIAAAGTSYFFFNGRRWIDGLCSLSIFPSGGWALDRSLSCLRWCWRGSRRFSCLGGRLLNPGAATPRIAAAGTSYFFFNGRRWIDGLCSLSIFPSGGWALDRSLSCLRRVSGDRFARRVGGCCFSQGLGITLGFIPRWLPVTTGRAGS